MAFPILHNGVLYAFPLYLRVGGRIYLGHGAVRLYHMMRPSPEKGKLTGNILLHRDKKDHNF